MRVIAYDVSVDYADIDEDTTIESMRRFAKATGRVFGPVYLRAPNKEDTKRLMAASDRRCLPGMPGSLDCLDWTWKNGPKA